MGWLDRFRRTSPARPGPGSADGTGQVAATFLERTEARRLVRDAYSNLAWGDQSRGALDWARGAAACRLDPEYEGAWSLNAAWLAHAGTPAAFVEFLAHHWPRATGGERRRLLTGWLLHAFAPADEPRAAADLERWIRRDAPDAEARAAGLAELTRRFVRRGLHSRAVESFRGMVEAAPWDVSFVLEAGAPLLRDVMSLGPEERACLWFHLFRVLRLPEAGAKLGPLAGYLGLVDVATALLDACAREQGNFDAPFLAAEAQVRAGSYEQGLERALAALARRPQSIYGLYLAVYALRMLGREPETAPLLDRMRALYEKYETNPDLAQAAGLDPPGLYANLLWFYGNFAADEAALCRVTARARAEGVAETGLLRGQGALFFRQGRWAEAAAALRTVVDADPEDGDATPLLVSTLLELGRPEEARFIVNRSYEHNPLGFVAGAEMEALMRAAGGRVPSRPPRLEAVRRFLSAQDWSFLGSPEEPFPAVELTVESIDWGATPVDMPRTTVLVRNTGAGVLPLAPDGPLGGPLHIYGYCALAGQGPMLMTAVTSRSLAEFGALAPGQEQRVKLDLTQHFVGRICFEEAKILAARGWLRAVLVPGPHLAALDMAVTEAVLAAGAGDPAARPERFELEPELQRAVTMSPALAFSSPAPPDLDSALQETEEGLADPDPARLYCALTRLRVLLSSRQPMAREESRRARLLARFEALADHPDPVIRGHRLTGPAPGSVDLSAAARRAASDPHWYVRLGALFSLRDQEDAQQPDWVVTLAEDADPLVRGAARELIAHAAAPAANSPPAN